MNPLMQFIELLPLLLFAFIGMAFTASYANIAWKEWRAKRVAAGGLTLRFQSRDNPPTTGEPGYWHDIHDFILWNQCDGFHIANSAYFEDGEFSHFTDFTGQYSWNANDFQAWARLPEVGSQDYDALHEKFHVRNPEATP